jgi:hypothetical protein
VGIEITGNLEMHKSERQMESPSRIWQNMKELMTLRYLVNFKKSVGLKNVGACR